MSLQSCPRCHFSFRPRAHFLTLDFCPRCLAERNVAINLVRVAEATIPVPDSATTSETTDTQHIAPRRQAETDRQRLARVIEARRRLGS